MISIFILILEIILGIIGLICFLVGAVVISAVLSILFDKRGR